MILGMFPGGKLKKIPPEIVVPPRNSVIPKIWNSRDFWCILLIDALWATLISSFHNFVHQTYLLITITMMHDHRHSLWHDAACHFRSQSHWQCYQCWVFSTRSGFLGFHLGFWVFFQIWVYFWPMGIFQFRLYRNRYTSSKLVILT